MGNVPLCVPKKGGPVVFTEGYNLNSGTNTIHMKEYHPYETSLEDLCSPELFDANDDALDTGGRRQSSLVGDTAIVGIEIDQDSVCVTKNLR